MKIDPIVDSTLKTAQGISEFGILIVIAALFLVFVIWMVWFFVSSMRKTMEKVLISQTAIMDQVKALNTQSETLQVILNKMAESGSRESLIEQTKPNAYAIIRESFNKNLLDLLSGATDIIQKNHIDNTDETYKKIFNVVEIAHKKRVVWLNEFKYHGTKLGDFANNREWIDRKVDILKCYIYSTHREPLTLIRELRMAYETFGYELNI